MGARRLLAVLADAPGVRRRPGATLVGRERELALLRHAFEGAAAYSRGHLFTVLGPAGVGKSRLVRELVADVGDRATVLGGRCLAYGEGITYWPLLDVVRQAAAIRAPRRTGRGPGANRSPAGRPSRGRRDRIVRRRRGRPDGHIRLDAGDVLGVPGAAGDDRPRMPARAGLRRPPLGGAHVPRPRRAARRRNAGPADPDRLPLAPRAPGAPARVGRRVRERELGAHRAARARGGRTPDRRARGRVTRRGHQANDHRRRRGQPALHRGDGGGRAGRWRRLRDAHDPGSAGDAARPSPPGGARCDRGRGGGRQVVQRTRRPRPDRRRRRGRPP